MNPLFVGAIIEWGGKLLDKLIPDEKARAEAQVELMKEAAKQQHEGMMGQLQVNLKEAENPNIFVSGWRPFIGWVCGSALAYNFILHPFLSWGMMVWFPASPVPPLLMADYLMELVFAMLGMAGWRTVEKIKGVASK